MIAGVSEEIMRLEYTLEQCHVRNPHNLDLKYMEKAIKLLKEYRDLHKD